MWHTLRSTNVTVTGVTVAMVTHGFHGNHSTPTPNFIFVTSGLKRCIYE